MNRRDFVASAAAELLPTLIDKSQGFVSGNTDAERFTNAIALAKTTAEALADACGISA